jgi:hypothetical protein
MPKPQRMFAAVTSQGHILVVRHQEDSVRQQLDLYEPGVWQILGYRVVPVLVTLESEDDR